MLLNFHRSEANPHLKSGIPLDYVIETRDFEVFTHKHVLALLTPTKHYK